MNTHKEHQNLSLLLGAGAVQPALAAHLDGLTAAQRIVEVRSLSGREQGELYARCAGAPAFTLADLCPAAGPADRTVIFAGKNSLPLFTRFEKRFTRLPGGAVVGYNHQAMSPFTGPGYFTVTEAGAELLFDYTRVPGPAERPSGWPPVKGNRGGLSFFVYRDLHDYCRRVSQDVIIGRATRLGEPMSQYFILARAEAPA